MDIDLQPIEKLFHYLNLVKTGLAFIEIIYTFGRYYRERYEFIVDFNIVMAVDFHKLY